MENKNITPVNNIYPTESVRCIKCDWMSHFYLIINVQILDKFTSEQIGCAKAPKTLSFLHWDKNDQRVLKHNHSIRQQHQHRSKVKSGGQRWLWFHQTIMVFIWSDSGAAVGNGFSTFRRSFHVLFQFHPFCFLSVFQGFAFVVTQKVFFCFVFTFGFKLKREVTSNVLCGLKRWSNMKEIFGKLMLFHSMYKIRKKINKEITMVLSMSNRSSSCCFFK